MTVRIDSLIDPKCTGMCGALAINDPSASNRAQLKSNLSLMFTEYAVLCRRTPICSAMFMKTLLNNSSITGSTRVPAAWRAARGRARCNSTQPPAVTDACQPGSTTVVELRSARMAGPPMLSPARNVSTRKRRASRQPPGSSSARQYMRTMASAAASGRASGTGTAAAAVAATPGEATPGEATRGEAAPGAMHSTATDSITIE